MRNSGQANAKTLGFRLWGLGFRFLDIAAKNGTDKTLEMTSHEDATEGSFESAYKPQIPEPPQKQKTINITTWHLGPLRVNP